ncbi:uncharacterized protein C10orf67 homolog, mitochondrial [Scyliorhinus canicula]|uniref:uncharacterized protein C10orf67 homolog, mitochondrial n=1 Tax=Scyliorhinus canicula TaxID=7830 RepID=UPI0018F67752|nr:uncharacterized protein C10orf67 homolog, mitochondrial [Scyliorhinus canicula]
MAAVTSPLESVRGNDQNLVFLLSYSSGANRYPGSGPSDHLKIGFFKTDRATQTDVSDILELKEMSNDVKFLKKEIDILKRSVQSKTQILKSDYSMKLDQQSLDLYNRINDHNSYLRDMYQQRIEVLRNSFKQQLADEIARINAGFKKYCSEIYAQNEMSLQHSFTTMDVLKQKDSLISSLKERLLQSEALQHLHQINFDVKDDFEHEELIEENEELKEQISFLKKNADRMSETIHSSEIQITQLEQELIVLKEKTEKSLNTIRKLVTSEEHLKMQLQAEEYKREKMLETQKLKMESVLTAAKAKMEEQERAAKELEVTLKQKESQLAQQIEISSLQKIASTEVEVCAVVEEPSSTDKAITDTGKLKEKEKLQNQHIESLIKQLDRTNRMWEKKFAIMKQSYHAIKDEMYLRCSLQRQAPNLHCPFTHYTIRDSGGIDCQGKVIFLHISMVGKRFSAQNFKLNCSLTARN